jgi:hypothetical protein
MLRVHVKMANELEALADFAEVVKCRRAVVWLMRDLSPRPNEKPASAKQRQWVAEWTVVVTDAMARLAHCLVQPPNDCVTEAVQWYTTAIALRVRQFGHGGIRLCVGFFCARGPVCCAVLCCVLFVMARAAILACMRVCACVCVCTGVCTPV